MIDFVHLHNHSDYSLLDGAVKIPWYVKEAKKYEMKHVALTDHGNLFGALRFEQACRNGGINPIVGCETYVAQNSMLDKSSENGRKNNHLVLYCKDVTGYRNLTKIVSKSYIDGFYYRPRIDKELLEANSEGLIASSACIGGEIPQLILNGKYDEAKTAAYYFQELLGKDHFYLELMDHGMEEEAIVNKALVRMSKETQIPLICTNDIHYLKKEHANAQDILICVGTNKKKNDVKRMRMGTELYFKSPEEMARLFDYAPESLTNTVKLAEMCNLEIPQPGPILPDYFIPEQFETEGDYLTHLVFKGLEYRYDEVTADIEERAKFEIATILDMGFPGYFLIVWDFIRWARDNDIPVGPGRGSGAGSIVAYALEITDIDPLQYDLLFERFLNPERVSMPDFDIDFCFERRQEVVDYVTRKYGYDQVGGICTFGTLKTKAVLKDVARVLDIPFDESNAISKLVPDDMKPPKDWEKSKIEYYIENVEELKEFKARGPIYEELFESAAILEGMNRHISTHACGKVIGKSKLTDFVPLYKDQKTGEITSEFTMDIIEPCGLVKMDFLGLKTLTLLTNIQNLVRKHTPDFNVDKVPEDDEKTFEMLSRGESTAVFQFESQGMQNILIDAKPQNIEDMIALNALYRPGPMQFIPQYVSGKKDPKTIEYPDASLEELLKPTYGVIVYQEQVMKVAQIIGGFSLGKADILRRAMGKKKVKDMEKMKVEFVEGARKNGHEEKHAVEIFEMLEPFAGYGFNKSHAAAYSVVAYKTAFCRANYPAEFMAANLTNEISSPDAFKLYIDEVKKMGIEIMPPDINISEKNFTVENGKIYYGLMGIKGVGSAAVDKIIAEREANGPYQSLIDLLERIDSGAVNKRVLEVSIQSGLFDNCDEHHRAQLYHNLEQIMVIINKKKENSAHGQASLFGDCEEEVEPEIVYQHIEEWSIEQILDFEKEFLGFYFSGHPLDDWKEAWEKSATLQLRNKKKVSGDKEYIILGQIKNMRITVTKRDQKKMAFGDLEDFDDDINFVLFPRTYDKYKDLLQNEKVVALEGKIDTRRNEPSFQVSKVIDPETIIPKTYQEVHLEIRPVASDEDDLIDFRSYLQERSGKSPLFLHFKRDSDYIVMRASSQLTVSDSDFNISEYCEHPLVASAWKE